MAFLKNLEDYQRLHAFIKTKSTGTPEQLAKRMLICKSTIYEMLRFMKEHGAPILYNKDRPSYQYEYDIEIEFFKVKPVDN